MELRTVGELRKFLEQFEDEKPLAVNEKTAGFVKVDDLAVFLTNLAPQYPVVFLGR